MLFECRIFNKRKQYIQSARYASMTSHTYLSILKYFKSSIPIAINCFVFYDRDGLRLSSTDWMMN